MPLEPGDGDGVGEPAGTGEPDADGADEAVAAGEAEAGTLGEAGPGDVETAALGGIDVAGDADAPDEAPAEGTGAGSWVGRSEKLGAVPQPATISPVATPMAASAGARRRVARRGLECSTTAEP